MSNTDTINVVYYGYVFDASGYGNAARAYIHALHEAGIALSVVDLANRGHQVHDALVESLQGQSADADFHLFHGIPPQWARLAFKQSRGIGMTVWETDAMPTQWRNTLNHMLEVWLPCEFNVTAFARALDRPVFRLPHPMSSRGKNGFDAAQNPLKEISVDDFVFYSIFEWQDRKCPDGLLSSFLGEFSASDRAALVIKTNPGAVGVARAALDAARKSSRSDARVLLYPEGWNDAQISALHERGNCYVSLHRGEGWNCPLFDAACLGRPVIATAYSGPMDYLRADDHGLVRYRKCPVQQPYLYYNSNMQWADPDLQHASELMRWTYGHQEEASARALRAAPETRESFSARRVGESARARMLSLIRMARPDRWKQVANGSLAKELAPPQPIPGEWYDSDYFETGLKSNWDGGYSWNSFAGLFEETARFLADLFPEAHTFLDVGCARGFLVRTLRERGKQAWGIDFSPWAIRNADRACAGFLQLASVDAFAIERKFDVVTAFSLLESLTEEQVRSFLRRFRNAAAVLFAVIHTHQNKTAAQSLARPDNDLSHITLRPREWWDSEFRAAGWRSWVNDADGCSRAQEQGLPSRMAWDVFAYLSAAE
jgi:2-polyprenyl-3-methyl-5-hydroxy-6-metoxy-1,4-benzoquinol methylase